MEAIGFIWDKPEYDWNKMFAALEKFKEQFDDCDVPLRWPENPKLGIWVVTQRTRYKKGNLSEEQIERLEEKGFVWDALEAKWEEMFGALVEFKKVQGHCNVPRSHPEYSKLGRWVNTQRINKKKGTLSPDHIQRLEVLGFRW